MCSAKSWQKVPFHANEYPSIAWFPKGKLTHPVEPLVFEDATEDARGRRHEEPPVPEVDPEAELAAVKELAERSGYERGKHEEQNRSQARIESLKKSVEGVSQAMRRGLDQAEREADRDAVRLAVMLAEHILQTKLADAEAVVSSLAPVVESMESHAPLSIICSPGQAALLQRQAGEIESGLGTAGLQISADEGLQDGDFLLRRGGASADARLAPRLERLRQSLLQALGLTEVVEPSRGAQ